MYENCEEIPGSPPGFAPNEGMPSGGNGRSFRGVDTCGMPLMKGYPRRRNDAVAKGVGQFGLTVPLKKGPGEPSGTPLLGRQSGGSG